MPVLGKYKFPGNKFRAYVVAGPEIGYALKGKIESIATVIIDIKLKEQALDLTGNNFNRFELAGTLGTRNK